MSRRSNILRSGSIGFGGSTAFFGASVVLCNELSDESLTVFTELATFSAPAWRSFANKSSTLDFFGSTF